MNESRKGGEFVIREILETYISKLRRDIFIFFVILISLLIVIATNDYY